MKLVNPYIAILCLFGSLFASKEICGRSIKFDKDTMQLTIPQLVCEQGYKIVQGKKTYTAHNVDTRGNQVGISSTDTCGLAIVPPFRCGTLTVKDPKPSFIVGCTSGKKFETIPQGIIEAKAPGYVGKATFPIGATGVMTRAALLVPD